MDSPRHKVFTVLIISFLCTVFCSESSGEEYVVVLSAAEYKTYIDMVNNNVSSIDTNECGSDDLNIDFDKSWRLEDTEIYLGNGTVLDNTSALWEESTNGILTFKMNETMHNCTDAECYNTLGSYYCDCPIGFAKENETCINCTDPLSPCHDNSTCDITSNVLTCTCDEGFAGDGIQVCSDNNFDVQINLTEYTSRFNKTFRTNFPYSSQYELFTTDYAAAVAEVNMENSTMKMFYDFLMQIQNAVQSEFVNWNITLNKADLVLRPAMVREGSTVIILEGSIAGDAEGDFDGAISSAAYALDQDTGYSVQQGDFNECLFRVDNCTDDEACNNTDSSYECIDKCPTCCTTSLQFINFTLANVPANEENGTVTVWCDKIAVAFLEDLLWAHASLFDNGNTTVQICDIEVMLDTDFNCVNETDNSTYMENAWPNMDARLLVRYTGSGIVDTTLAQMGLESAMDDDSIDMFTDPDISFKLDNATDVTIKDIDECSTGSDTCDERAWCSNIDGSYTCTCNTEPETYYGDGETCNEATDLICTPTQITFYMLEDFGKEYGLTMDAIHFGGENYANTSICRTGVNVEMNNMTYWKFPSPEDFSLCGGLSKSSGLTVQVNMTISNLADDASIAVVGSVLNQILSCELTSIDFNITSNDPYTAPEVPSEIELNIPSQKGSIKIAMNIYQNEDFTEPYTEAIQLSANKFLPIGVSIDTKDANIFIAISQFWASSNADGSDPYYLIENYCPRPGMVEVESQGDSAEAKIRLLAFTFTDKPSFSLFLVADILTTPLTIECGSARKRRSTDQHVRKVLLKYNHIINKPLSNIVLTTTTLERPGIPGNPGNGNPPVPTASSMKPPISPTTEGTGETPENLSDGIPDHVWMIIAFAAAGILLIAAVVIFVVKMNQRKKNDKVEKQKSIDIMQQHIDSFQETY